MTSRLRDVVEQLLSEYVAETTPDSLGLREAANRLRFLPLVNDMGGCFGIRPNGEIVSCLWDELDHVRIETDPWIRAMVIYRGSLRRPVLQALVPQRPETAVRCPSCDGTGKLAGYSGNVVCGCGGLGWLDQRTAS
jgi:hypothetical protein